MAQRKEERFEFQARVTWDFFAQTSGKKGGTLVNISRSGCLLKADEFIENRRWVRLFIEDSSSNLYITCVGRVVRTQLLLEGAELGLGDPVTYYGIEFTFPNYLSLGATDLILALSRRNLMVRSCLNRNSRSPFRPGFLA